MKAFKWFVLLSLSLFLLSACGGSGGSSDEGDGRLTLNLTDASTDEYQAVYVTITEVKIHLSSSGDMAGDDNDSWKVVAAPNKTCNLLELVNGAMEQLGTSDLAAGHYTQMRLLIGENPDDGININDDYHPHANYIILADETIEELTIPSGLQSGIKLTHGFDVAADATTELILDFDALKSIVKANKGGKYLLKPTIKILDSSSSYSVSGVVSDESGALAGATVSAQVYDANATDDKDMVTVFTSTISNDEGGYSITLEPGTYFLVASKDNYTVACEKVIVESSSVIQDFALETATATGTVSGGVDITGGDSEEALYLSFRQESTCDGTAPSTMIEVQSLNLSSDSETFTVDLPVGTYALVVYGNGIATQTYSDLEVSADTTTDQDVSDTGTD